MSNELRTYRDAVSAAQACGAAIMDLLNEARRERAGATLAVSGGSTPRLMFEWLAKQNFDWRGVHLFWVDERCVAPGDELSNYGHAEHDLILPAHIPQRQVHRIYGELLPSHAAERYVDHALATLPCRS